MIESEHIIRLDIHDPSYQKKLNIIRNDTCRKLIIKLYEDGKLFTIPDGCKAKFVARKRDNTSVFNECAIENNCIVYELTTQTTAVAGTVKCEIRLNDENDELVTSPRFSLFVMPSVYIDGDVEEASKDEIDALSNLLSTLEDSFNSGKFNGVGIESIKQTVSASGSDGQNIITITLTDGTKSNFIVKNGSKGSNGYTPIKGEDYYTDEDKEEILEMVNKQDITAQDGAILGAELATASGWTLGAGWSGSLASGFTHASGNTEPLTFTPTIKAGGLYQVTFKSSVAMTITNLFVQVGNSTQFNLYGDITDAGSISIGILAADNSGLVFTPESSFTGTLTEISIKEITGSYEAVKQFFDTNNAVSFEIHVTPRGLENVFIGASAGETNTSGRANVGIGPNVLKKNTSGFWNSAIGTRCLQNNIGGSRNIAIGYQSLMNNTVGQRNIGIGTFTMTNMTDGNWNIAIGADSMNVATGGDKNTAVGFDTLTHNKGNYNVALGAHVLAQNTTGENNTAIGVRALSANTSGKENMAFGFGALQKNTVGSWNTAIGNAALYNLTTGQKNVAIGTGAGKSLTTGKRCIAIGAEADLEATVNDQLNIGNLLKGSLASGAAYLSLNGGLRVPSIPTAYSSNDTEVWNNGGVLMVGNGGMDTIVQAVISALPVYNGEVE